MRTTLQNSLPAVGASQLVSVMKKCADAIDLVYVNDHEPGITRKPKGKGFVYYFNGKTVKDKKTLDRIRSLVIPPAWENVWICPDEKGHLQATGSDFKNRKQYRYHPEWNQFRNQTKFTNLLDFGETLPQMRKQMEKDIAQPELNENKAIALVLQLMEKTYIRIGNSYYEKTNGSHGLTTMKNKHVKISGHSIEFSFIGKKGVSHNITLKSKKLARLVKQCRELPGKELFQYIAQDGTRKKVDSGMVNNYIKQISNKQFTTKDFRTWAGSVNALKKIKEIESAGEGKVKLNEIIDHVSRKLGNTRTVCKKYYIHPLILEHYENGTLPSCPDIFSTEGLTPEEQWLIKILKNTPKLKKS